MSHPLTFPPRHWRTNDLAPDVVDEFVAHVILPAGAFDPDKAYKDSKLCNLLFQRELVRRLALTKSPVTVNAFGPGLITRTGFFRNQPGLFVAPFDFLTNEVFKVATSVRSARPFRRDIPLFFL